MNDYRFSDEEMFETIVPALELGQLSTEHNIIYRSQEIQGTFKQQAYIIAQQEQKAKFKKLLATIRAYHNQQNATLPNPDEEPSELEQHVHNIHETKEGGITKWLG